MSTSIATTNLDATVPELEPHALPSGKLEPAAPSTCGTYSAAAPPAAAMPPNKRSLLGFYAKSFLVGVPFGMALYKARMHWPIMIMTQMRFQSHSMLQMYLVATVSGMFGFVLVEALGLYKRAPKPPLSLGVESLGRFGANILGGSMIGTGMALAGACPGTLILQTSTGIPSAIPAISGAAVASVSYGYLVQAIRSVIPNYGAKSPAITIDGLIAQSSSTKPATQKAAAGAAAQKHLHHTFAFSAALVSVLIIPFIAALHRYKPYDADVAAHLNITTTGGSPTTAVVRIDGFPPHPSAPLWSAIGAGLVIGATQLASLLLLGRPIGASSVYPYFGAQVAKRLDRRWYANAPFFKDYVNDHENAFFVAGMVAGAAAAAAAAGGGSVLAAAAAVQHPAGAAALPSVGAAFAGGLLLVFGSRVAGGCTSGHGISGVAQLSVASFVSVAAMFAAAMGLSAVIY